MIIIGAGLSGLIAGNVFQRARLIEAGPESQLTHRAVLRFRSRAVADATGIEFREVTVRKGIWYNGSFATPNIQIANHYSRKALNGALADRSIWNIESCRRFIAPENFAEQLAERCERRISWNTAVRDLADLRPAAALTGNGTAGVISTIPMPTLVALFPGDAFSAAPEFKSSAITVTRHRIKNADVFQTIYFADPAMATYRASITGDLLIVEAVGSIAGMAHDAVVDLYTVCDAFGIKREALTTLDVTAQRFGKIAPIDEAWRRNFILRATLDHGVFSLGRFAVWKNLLLDDIVHDCAVIKRLMAHGAYAQVLQS